LGFWRLILASLLLRLFFLKGDFFKIPNNIKLYFNILVSGVFLYLHFWTFFYAAQNTSIASTVILFCLNPLSTSLLAWGLLKEKITSKTVLSYLFGLSSVVILFWPHFSGEGASHGMADSCALISALFYSIYVVFGKKGQISGEISSTDFSSLTFLVAGILFLLHELIIGSPGGLIHLNSKAIIALILLTLIPTLLGHALFLKLTKVLNINWMSAGKLLEPPLASVSAFLLFQQTPSVTALGAFLLLIPALIFLVWAKEAV